LNPVSAKISTEEIDIMKAFINKIKEYKSIILKLTALLLIVVAISLLTLVVLMATGILSYDDGFHFDSHLFDSFKGKWYGVLVFILLQTILSILLCAIPGVAMALVAFSQVLYQTPWQAFLLSFASVLISSTVLYIIGRAGGYRICTKLLGKEDCEKSLQLLRTRGTVYFPLMMLFPIFPDDALVMIAGTIKMRLSWFIPSIVIGRGIGISGVLLTVNLIPFERFTSFYDWAVLITVCFFWIRELFKLANKLDRHLEKKRQEKKALENKENSIEV